MRSLLLLLAGSLSLCVATGCSRPAGEAPATTGTAPASRPTQSTEPAPDGPSSPPSSSAAPIDTALIEQLTGAKGKMNDKEGVFKVQIPRTDLKVTAGGVKMTPPLGLTAWAAFQKMRDHTMVMGDIVLLEDQVNLVMSAALDAGLDVTALHNHFFWESPRVMFMHVGGMGDEKTLATAIGKVFATMKKTAGGKGQVLRAPIDPAKSQLDSAALDATLGQKGEYKDGVYKVVVGRKGKMDEAEIGGAMGVNTWAAFAGTADQAVVDGDFVMLESELRKVLVALREAGIAIVAIHNHMSGEEPRFVFLHYWGIGEAADLARGVRAGLDQTAHE